MCIRDRWLILLAKINTKWLVPLVLIKGKKVLFIALIMLTSFLSVIITRKIILTEFSGGYIFENVRLSEVSITSRKGIHTTVIQLASLATLLSTTIIQIYKKNRETEKQMAQVALAKKEAELKLLRTQFNPHFLLNTLNNLYSVAITKPAKSTAHIERLISLMKYLTYDLTDDRIELIKELDFIDDYIFFQTEKDSERFNVKKTISIAQPNAKIEPRILIPFVENAFKHAYHPEKKAQIQLNCVQVAHHLEFTITNTTSDFVRNKKEEGYFGLGVDSTIQLLDSVYGQNKNIEVRSEEYVYSVKLTINNIFSDG